MVYIPGSCGPASILSIAVVPDDWCRFSEGEMRWTTPGTPHEHPPRGQASLVVVRACVHVDYILCVCVFFLCVCGCASNQRKAQPQKQKREERKENREKKKSKEKEMETDPTFVGARGERIGCA